jgi:hypothetical protein
MVDPDVKIFGAIMMILVPSFSAVVATVVVGIRALRRKDDRRVQAPMVDDERMLRLEQAVDAIALELERVGEGQRYLTQVMTQRLPAATAPNGSADVQRGRVITPH